MPNCFQLTRKTDLDAGPVSLTKIDEEMCEHFGVKPDPELYYNWWYDTIGFSLACGSTFEQLRQRCFDQRMLDIIDWLDENFTSDAWAEVGRGR